MLMNATSLGAILAYLATAGLLFATARQTAGNGAALNTRVSIGLLIALGLMAHIISVYLNVVRSNGFNLGFFQMSSLIFAFVCSLALLNWLRRKPVTGLLLILFPLAALSVGTAMVFSGNYTVKASLSGGIVAHIVLSVLAYSTLTLAALQAALLGLQVRQLKHKQDGFLVSGLPPLQTMEELLFELLWAGVVLLSLGIMSGAFYLDDIFAQHLIHKTAFSLCAWLVLTGLLAGKHFYGWRGKKAARWTLLGFALLAIGYFGSKLVLELILQRV